MRNHLLPILAAAAAVVAVLVLAACGSHHGSPAQTPAKPAAPKLNDKASDCWAHPDRAGHRHCAS